MTRRATLMLATALIVLPPSAPLPTDARPRPRAGQNAELCNSPSVGGLVATTAVAQEGGEWGTVKGRITWGGDNVPVQAPINLPAGNPAVPMCVQANKNMPPLSETWVVNKSNKGVKNTFVWLADFADTKSQKPLPIHPDLKEIKVKKVEVDQPACHFIPQALALREGQKLVVKNSAPFAHNFKWAGDPFAAKASGNNLIPPGGSNEIELKASRYPILVECNIHPWMRGWIRVYSHPYFAVTDDNGAFELKDAPAGKFRLMVWHGSAGWKGGAAGKDGEPIEIKAGAVMDLGAIAFPPPKD